MRLCLSDYYNSRLQLVTFEEEWLSQMDVPEGFLIGHTEPHLRLFVRSTFGGPWRVEASRKDDGGDYYLHGSEWKDFIKGSRIEKGTRVLFAMQQDLDLDAITFCEKGKGCFWFQNNRRFGYDWIVMIRSPILELYPDTDSDTPKYCRVHACASGEQWQFNFSQFCIENYPLSSSFCARGNIKKGSVLTLTNVKGEQWDIGVDLIEGRLHLTTGLKEFMKDCQVKVGDHVIFQFGLADEVQKPRKRGQGRGIPINFYIQRARGGDIDVNVESNQKSKISKRKFNGPSYTSCAQILRGESSRTRSQRIKVEHNQQQPQRKVGLSKELRYRNSYSKQMNIPRTFADDAGLVPRSKVKVRTCDGQIWSFSGIKGQDYFRLSGGWPEFVKKARLTTSNVLKFTVLGLDDEAMLSLSIKRVPKSRA